MKNIRRVIDILPHAHMKNIARIRLCLVYDACGADNRGAGNNEREKG